MIGVELEVVVTMSNKTKHSGWYPLDTKTKEGFQLELTGNWRVYDSGIMFVEVQVSEIKKLVALKGDKSWIPEFCFRFYEEYKC